MEEEENYSLQTESTWEHKALSGTDSNLCARCKSVLWEKPPEERPEQKNGTWKGPIWVLTTSLTRFAQGELISRSAAI